jgi:hypothetical protein
VSPGKSRKRNRKKEPPGILWVKSKNHKNPNNKLKTIKKAETLNSNKKGKSDKNAHIMWSERIPSKST